MITVGGMVWRLDSEITGFFEQVEWFEAHGLRGVAFHTAPAFEGEWQSFDVRQASKTDRRRLRQALQGFDEVSVHGEFDNYDVCLSSANELIRKASVATLAETMALAAEIGAPVVTTHEGSSRTRMPDSIRRGALSRSITDLAALAQTYGVSVGLELVRDYDLVLELDCRNVGVTLDTGHVSMHHGAGYRAFDSIGNLIRHLGDRLIHVHIHDYDGVNDHLALGAGHVDFGDIASALLEIHYTGMLCLELNWTRTRPEDYVLGMALIDSMLASG